LTENIFVAEDQGIISEERLLRKIRLRNKISGKEVDVKTELLGDYQLRNLPTVLTATEVLRQTKYFDIPEEAIKKGIEKVCRNTGLRGRWEVLGQRPLIVADTGHNYPGLELVIQQIRACSYKTLHCIIGF